jgi:alanine dehydrogenase
MVLILSESDVSAVLSMAQGVQIVERAFGDAARGDAMLVPRVSLDLPGTAGAFRIMPAVLPVANCFGLKTLTGYPGRRLPGETYFAILLFEMKTGALRAVIAGSYLTGIRTGATTGVATKYLARKKASVLGVFGAGVQARHQVQAVIEVREIKLVKVFDLDQAKAADFADWITSEYGIEAVVPSSAREAVEHSDVLVTATTSREPIFASEWLEPGTHVNGVGANTPAKQELDPGCFARSKIVVDFKAQVLEEAGDLRRAIAVGAVAADQIYAEMGEIVAGRKKGRENESEITLFKSVGVANADISIAQFVYESAVAQAVGTSLPLDQSGSQIMTVPELSSTESLPDGAG